MNSLLFWKFKLINLLFYQVQDLKQTKKFCFKFLISLSFVIPTIQPNFVFRGIILELHIFILTLFLKLLSIIEVLVALNHQFLELSEQFFYRFCLALGSNIFVVLGIGVKSTILLKGNVASTSVFCIFIGKFCHQEKFCLIILFIVCKSSEIGFHDSVFPLGLAIYLKVKNN